jgi:hypothetical protein
MKITEVGQKSPAREGFSFDGNAEEEHLGAGFAFRGLAFRRWVYPRLDGVAKVS